ncbi:MAG: FxsA family protein [Planctomycetes bacterium]|nr:FxsA family protein [Planctomycetota bacterium]
MFFRLLLLFTLVPLIELALLVKLGQMTSVAMTIGIVILTGIIGAYLARREGIKAWRRLEKSIREGVSPADELIDALLILIAGAVLITPGLLTDLFGFGLLISPMRRWVRNKLSRHFHNRIMISTPDARQQQYDYDIIDVPPQDPPSN